MGTISRFAIVMAGLTLTTVVAAADLRLGTTAEPTTIDPHFFNSTSNMDTYFSIFDPLVTWDASYRITPNLAATWQATSDRQWVFKLRDGVTFQDGSKLTSDDVVFSYQRARNVPNSPASFQQFLKHVVAVTVVDPLTLRIDTDQADPLLLAELANVAIVPHGANANATTDDYNSGKAAIGTGPYRLAEWVRGDRLVLQRNEAYFGPRPVWDRAIFKPRSNDAARSAALLSGDVDIVNNVAANDVAVLRDKAGIVLAQGNGARWFHLQLDSNRDTSPFVTDLNGQKLTPNPLKDVRVRRALSKAIDREALVGRVLQGQGVPSQGVMPHGFYGVSPALKPEPFDAAGARALLADAGYPNGFALTIHGTNGRFPNDTQVLQAVAAMWTRVGIRVQVEAMSGAIYYPRMSKLEFSVMFNATGTDSGEAMSMMQYVLQTFDAAKGVGPANRGRFSDARLDALLTEASGTLDDAKRETLLIQAEEYAIRDMVAVVPLYFPINTWAMRKGIGYKVRADERTLPAEIRAE